MKPDQVGFTLIEMMIVVAIIGILSAIALGSYDVYTKRTHVSEGLVLSASARLSVANYYSRTATLPTNNTAAGLPTSTSISGNSVKSVEVLNDGRIEITFNEKAGNNETLVYELSTSSSTTSWDCTGGTLGNIYRPQACR